MRYVLWLVVAGGGCIGIGAGKHGAGIDKDALVTLAEAAAGRAD